MNRVRVRQDHHEEDDLAEDPCLLHERLAEVDLSLSGAVNEREEDLLPGALDGADSLPDLRVATLVSVLPDSLVDPFGCVPLLAGYVAVGLNYRPGSKRPRFG